MSNKDGILITNEGVYGLVNPPPAPSSKDAALPHQDISSAAVRWDTFVDLSNSGFSFTPANPTFMSLIDKIPYTLNDRGSSYRVLERFDLAIDDYLAAIDLNPDLAFVQFVFVYHTKIL